MKAAVFALAAILATAASAGAQVREVIADIQIHGNFVTPEADVVAAAGVKRGDVFEAGTLDLVRERLEKTGRFERVEVRKRFASIDDPSQIALVIIVDEHPVSIVGIDDAAPGAGARIARRSRFGGAMFMPILDGEDGYGLAYGVVVAYPDAAGKGSRVMFPLSWGGRKQAGVQVQRPIARGPIDRVEGGATITRRTNPAFEIDDDRVRVWGRGERLIGDVRLGTTAAWQRVSFAAETEAWRSIGADATWDTRLNPIFPRNAVFVRAEWTHLAGDRTGRINRIDLDARGYIGLIGQAVLVARIERQSADRTLPDYFKPLLGGWSSLRGYRAGSFVGDTRVNGSLELRVPLTSPLSVSKLGLSVFTDVGKSYDRPLRFADAPLHRGVGAGLWFSAAVVQFGVSVARGAGNTRANVSVGVGF